MAVRRSRTGGARTADDEVVMRFQLERELSLISAHSFNKIGRLGALQRVSQGRRALRRTCGPEIFQAVMQAFLPMNPARQ